MKIDARSSLNVSQHNRILNNEQRGQIKLATTVVVVFFCLFYTCNLVACDFLRI